MTEVKPEDQGGVTDAILTAIAERAPMEIVGSATMRTIGRPLATPVKLDLSGLAGLNFYEPEELVLSAKAGTRRSAIDELRGRRQAFAFEPPDLARLLGSNQGGTLGGMIAANLSRSAPHQVGRPARSHSRLLRRLRPRRSLQMRRPGDEERDRL